MCCIKEFIIFHFSLILHIKKFKIIDEEHEPSYKQFEKRPLFHARDAAFYLARQWGAHLLMGSATPSYEMLHLAAIDKIKLATVFIFGYILKINNCKGL